MEIVRRVFDACAAGGVEAVLGFFAPDVLLYPFPEWPGPSEYRGHDGVRALLAEWIENFDDFEIEVREIREARERVLMLGETVGRIKGSGAPIRQPFGAIYWDFDDGRIGDGRFFLTWREALKAVGLTEQRWPLYARGLIRRRLRRRGGRRDIRKETGAGDLAVFVEHVEHGEALIHFRSAQAALP